MSKLAIMFGIYDILADDSSLGAPNESQTRDFLTDIQREIVVIRVSAIDTAGTREIVTDIYLYRVRVPAHHHIDNNVCAFNA